MTGAALALAAVLGITAPYSVAEQREIKSVLESCESYTATLTFYTHTGNPTASGVYPEEGRTVACNWLDMGTIVYIEGYGTYTVEDTGYMPFENNVDVFLDSYDDCIQHGVQRAKLIVLTVKD